MFTDQIAKEINEKEEEVERALEKLAEEGLVKKDKILVRREGWRLIYRLEPEKHDLYFKNFKMKKKN